MFSKFAPPETKDEPEKYSEELKQVAEDLSSINLGDMQLCSAIMMCANLSLTEEDSCSCLDEISAHTEETVFANLPAMDNSDAEACNRLQMLKKMYNSLEHRKIMLNQLLELDSPLPSDFEISSDDDDEDDNINLSNVNSNSGLCNDKEESDDNKDKDWTEELEFKEQMDQFLRRSKGKIKEHSKRNVPTKNYKEEDVSDEDEYIYCDDCQSASKDKCEIHTPMHFIRDRVVPPDCPSEYNALKTIPICLTFSLSGIKGAGVGVWTESVLPKNSVFGPYKGCIEYSAEKAKESGCAWQIRKKGQVHHYVDARDLEHSNWMRYVNCANFEQQQNMISFQYKGEIYYRTYKEVLPSRELLIWYGGSYAKELGIGTSESSVELPIEPSHPIFRCSFCNKAFTAENYLNAHFKKKHQMKTQMKKYKCTYCCYSTNWSTGLKLHFRRHTNDKPFICNICGKGFTVNSNLKVHFGIHTGEKRFKCDICEKSFMLNHHFKDHMKIHSKEKPYCCDNCGRCFTHNYSLLRHMKQHTGDKLYQCSHCLYRAPSYEALKYHIKSKHSLT